MLKKRNLPKKKKNKIINITKFKKRLQINVLINQKKIVRNFM